MALTARIDAIGLVCSDLRRTLAFYRLLGCDLPEPEPGEEPGHVECDLGGVRLMFDTEAVVASFSPGATFAADQGRLALAAGCADPAEVDRLHSELSAAGAGSSLQPFDAPWGQRYATVLDPDGVSVDLYAPLPAGG